MEKPMKNGNKKSMKGKWWMKMVIKKRSPPKDYNASSGFRGDDGVFFGWLLCVVKMDVVVNTIF
ncbi:hypothetical protein HanPSC8_Chr05g0223601 [Helianthus annuus]|nr:hypothetical protein HanPSC8_Chr05g0223601 [Helianthus annuus]